MQITRVKPYTHSIEQLQKETLKYKKAYIYLTSFDEACIKILNTLENTFPKKIFSHNDLLAKSIYIDLQRDTVRIVDWEYVA